MKHISTTSFGRRPAEACQIAAGDTPCPANVPDKWDILRDLVAARDAFGVTDRDLTVLSALLSFHPEARLGDGDGAIVFPSNRALGARAHGMAESTLRRHLAALVRAGLIRRHDSPNGKRYARRDLSGGVDVAFGFDLCPLLLRGDEIAQAARAAREAALRLKRLREGVVIALRDAGKLILHGVEEGVAGCLDLEPDLAGLRRRLRRRLDLETLEVLRDDVRGLLGAVNAALSPARTQEMSGNAIESERHIQDSKHKPFDSELSQEKGKATAVSPPSPDVPPDLPLYLVLKSCPDLLDYRPDGIGSWRDLVVASERIGPMLGISSDALQAARAAMGPVVAAVVIACILQKGPDIYSPGGYLRALVAKAEQGLFSPGPMVMALLKAENTRAV